MRNIHPAFPGFGLVTVYECEDFGAGEVPGGNRSHVERTERILQVLVNGRNGRDDMTVHEAHASALEAQGAIELLGSEVAILPVHLRYRGAVAGVHQAHVPSDFLAGAGVSQRRWSGEGAAALVVDEDPGGVERSPAAVLGGCRDVRGVRTERRQLADRQGDPAVANEPREFRVDDVGVAVDVGSVDTEARSRGDLIQLLKVDFKFVGRRVARHE